MTDDQIKAIAQPTDAELLRFGYAPGDYFCRCITCEQSKPNLDKRAVRCRDCACALRLAYEAGKKERDAEVEELVEALESLLELQDPAGFEAVMAEDTATFAAFMLQQEAKVEEVSEKALAVLAKHRSKTPNSAITRGGTPSRA